jgi:hypothetical protein
LKKWSARVAPEKWAHPGPPADLLLDGGRFEYQSSFQDAMNHGGKRAGAGRKPGARALVMRSKAEGILATVNEEKIWQRLLRSRNDRIVLEPF